MEYAHQKPYRDIEYIVKMEFKQLESKSITELADYKIELKDVFRRLKTDRQGFDKRKSFYKNAGNKMNDLMAQIDKIKKIIKDKKRQQKINKGTKQVKSHPFIDDETLELFNYIVENWDYKYDLKFSYIFNELIPGGNPPGDYEKYVRTNVKMVGKFNYNNALSKKIIDELKGLIKKKKN